MQKRDFVRLGIIPRTIIYIKKGVYGVKWGRLVIRAQHSVDKTLTSLLEILLRLDEGVVQNVVDMAVVGLKQ